MTKPRHQPQLRLEQRPSRLLHMEEAHLRLLLAENREVKLLANANVPNKQQNAHKDHVCFCDFRL